MDRIERDAFFSLLSGMGYQYAIRDGDAHITMSCRGRRWDAVLRMTGEAILIYSCFPYEVRCEEKPLQYCNEANAGLTEGALLVGKNNAWVRTAVLRTDDFYLREQLRHAMERNAAVVLKHWNGLYKAAAPHTRGMRLSEKSS